MSEIKFPLVFEECPNCQSTRRLTDEVKAQHGQEADNVKQALTMVETPVASPVRMHLALPIPWIIAAFDACADCGTLYCVLANVQVKMPPQV